MTIAKGIRRDPAAGKRDALLIYNGLVEYKFGLRGKIYYRVRGDEWRLSTMTEEELKREWMRQAQGVWRLRHKWENLLRTGDWRYTSCVTF